MANPVEQRHNIARIPITPMDYDSNEKSVKGELMIDWENRTLYAKKLDGQIVHIGEPQINIEISQKLGVGFTYGVHPLPMRWEFDTRCINFLNKIVQLRDYNTAETLTIPFKDNTGVLSWMNRYDVGASAMIRTAKTLNKGNNNMIVLVAGTFNKSENLEGHIDIKLPTNLTESYNKIVWRLITNDNVDFSFPDFEINWEYNNEPFKSNTTRTYQFETWDNGLTWNGSYINNIGIEPSWEYDKKNYFTKDEITTSSSWSYPGDDKPQGAFKIVCVKTQQEYNDLEKDNNTFYFVENSSEVYRGENDFSKHFEVVNSFNIIDPVLINRIYINKTNFEMKYYDGTDWIQIGKPVTDDMSIENNDDYIPTKIAIINYIKSLLSNVVDEKNDSKIATIKSIRDYLNNSSDFITNSSYEKGVISFVHNLEENNHDVLLPDVIIGFDINLKDEKIIIEKRTDLKSENPEKIEYSLPPHIKDGFIDVDNEKITLNLTDKTSIDIDIADLLARIVSSKSGFVNSDSLKITIDHVSGSNMGNVRISIDNDNMIEVRNKDNDKGLFVPNCIRSLNNQKGNRIPITEELDSNILKETEFQICDSTNDTFEIDDDVKLITKLIIENLIRKATNIYPADENIIQFKLDEDNPDKNGFYITLDKTVLDKFNILYKFEDGEYTPNNVLIISQDGGKADSGFRLSNEISDFYLTDEDETITDENGETTVILAKENYIIPSIRAIKSYIGNNDIYINNISENDVSDYFIAEGKWIVQTIDAIGDFKEDELKEINTISNPGNMYLASPDISFEEPIEDEIYGLISGFKGVWSYYKVNDDNSLTEVNEGDTVSNNEDYLFRCTFNFLENNIITNIKNLDQYYYIYNDNTILYDRYITYHK